MSTLGFRQEEKENYIVLDKRRIFSTPFHMMDTESTVAAKKDKDVPVLASYLKLCSSLLILPFHVEFKKTEGTWNSQKSTKRFVSI